MNNEETQNQYEGLYKSGWHPITKRMFDKFNNGERNSLMKDARQIIQPAKENMMLKPVTSRLLESQSDATCNGCGLGLSENEIAFTNNDGYDYCADCNEAIQGDPESAVGLIDTEVDTIEQWANKKAKMQAPFKNLRERDIYVEALITGASHFKATHVPIEEVEKLIDYKISQFEESDAIYREACAEQSIFVALTSNYKVLKSQIRNLIKC